MAPTGNAMLAPIPGYSPDTLATCLQHLELITLIEPRSCTDISTMVRTIPDSLPSLRFAIETALRAWLATAQDAPSPRKHGSRGTDSSSPQRLALACLVHGQDETELREATEDALRRGYRTLKWKLGVWGDFARELRAWQELRDSSPASFALRFDANTHLDRRAFFRHEGAILRLGIEFLEQPFPPADPAWHDVARSPVPLALDESLHAPRPAERTVESTSATYLVLKPATLGGAQRCLDLTRLAHEHGKTVIVSHALDGTACFAANMDLAFKIAALGIKHGVPGLAPHAAVDAHALASLGFVVDQGQVSRLAVNAGDALTALDTNRSVLSKLGKTKARTKSE